MSRYIIGSVTFGPDGSVALEYMDVAEQRKGITLSKVLVLTPELGEDPRLPVGPVIAGQLEDLERSCQRALDGALAALEELPAPAADDDDEPGYDNPGERERYR